MASANVLIASPPEVRKTFVQKMKKLMLGNKSRSNGSPSCRRHKVTKSSTLVTRYWTRTMITRTLRFLAPAVSRGEVERGVPLCGSGVGASVAANKVIGVGAAVCHDDFSVRQGGEEDNMKHTLLRRPTSGIAVAWDCTKNFLAAKFSDAERNRRRLAKAAKLEVA
jgi:RpiB/LacA/LacB family sugar-phosphate isomerase